MTKFLLILCVLAAVLLAYVTLSSKLRSNRVDLTELVVPRPSIMIMVAGLVAGWEAGTPAAPMSMRQYIIEPLRQQGIMDLELSFCLEKPMNMGTFAEVLTWGRAQQHIYNSSDKFSRRKECYSRTLAERTARGDSPPDWWLSTRADVLYFSSMPLLTTLAKDAVHARARMAHLINGLTTDHFSWVFDEDTGGSRNCVEWCPPPCNAFLRPFFMADDQLHVIPSGLVEVFLTSPISIDIASSAEQCINATKVGREALFINEMFFTCSALVAGVPRFEGLRLAARLNPHARRTPDFYSRVYWPLKPPVSKPCF